MRMFWSIAVITGLLAAGPPGTALATAVSGATPVPAAAPVPVLHWHSCDTSFQCATARVPLDYRHPRGATIRIAMIRHLATGPARPIGSLFFNPGGPGGPGTLVLPRVYPLLPALARARFDIVSFDPRGIGRSTAVRCFPTAAAENRFLARLPAGFPVGARQDAAWERGYARFDEICADRGNRALIDHDTTADVARDLDLMRRAVHDPVLNYLGVSYGTVLGATYANLFPRKVGAMVLDGNVNPVAWTHGGRLPTSLRMGADLASAATLRSFLSLCGGVSTARCAFSAGTPAATRAKFATLLRRLRKAPVTVGAHTTYTYAATVTAVRGFLYAVKANRGLGDIGWPAGARLLQRLWTASGSGRPGPASPHPVAAVSGQAALVSGQAALVSGQAPAGLYNGPEQEFAVLCSDSPNPGDPAGYPALARVATARSGAVGAPWAWLTEPCATWRSSSQDRYTGPWNRLTAHPILVIGNTGDPATPYQDSVAMSHLLARARLLTVDGFGHTETLNPSTCATDYETRYLLTGALPPVGAVCRQNGQPFPG